MQRLSLVSSARNSKKTNIKC